MPRQRETDVCELLREQNRILGALLDSQGVTAQEPDESIAAAYSYAALPPDRETPTLALPPGEIQVDFENGTVKHGATPGTAFSDAGDLGIDLRTIDDMTTPVGGTTRRTLRSIQIWSDIDGAVQVGREGGFVHLFGGLYQTIKSHGFRRFSIHAAHPFELRANVSTRSDSFVTSDQRGAMTRRGERAAGAHDSYVNMFWWPGGMDAVLSDALTTSLDHTDYQVAEIPTLGHDNITVMVENDSGNGNAIDAKLQARDEPLESFYDIGSEVTAIADGDHTTFDIQEEHRELRAQIKNNTATQTVSASGQLTAGGT